MKKDKKERQVSKNKEKKDISKNILIVLIVLVALEVCMIPCFIYAGMNQIFPIVMFLIFPTLFAIFVLLLSRNTLIESKKKRKILEERRSSIKK